MTNYNLGLNDFKSLTNNYNNPFSKCDNQYSMNSFAFLPFINTSCNLPMFGNFSSFNFSNILEMFPFINSNSSNSSRCTNNVVSNPSMNLGNYNGSLGHDIAVTANKYVGYNENDGSYLKFTNGQNRAWCASFVSYVLKETYRNQGKDFPQGLNTASVSGLKSWGIKNNKYVQTNDMSQAQRSAYIAQNIKPGDVVIYQNGGMSHSGIVANVNSDGSFTTIEGNTSGDSVAYRNKKPDNANLTGFIRVADRQQPIG